MPSFRSLLPVLCSILLVACADEPVSPAQGEWGHHDHGAPALSSAPTSASQNQINAAIRQATARYQQIEVALADSFTIGSPCVPGMGYHYIREDRLDGVVDPSRPELLVYEPQKNGRLRLVAVEFMVPAAAWDPFNDGPPLLGERAFDDHRAPGSGGPPFPHYQLHAWVWMNNPDGIYTPFNPTSSCRYAAE